MTCIPPSTLTDLDYPSDGELTTSLTKYVSSQDCVDLLNLVEKTPLALKHAENLDCA